MKRFSFGLSVSAAGFGPDWLRNGLKRRWRPIVMGTSVAIAGAGVYRYHHQNRKSANSQPQRVKINQEVIELICGAVGEIAQIIILYPLDTIKVRCQTEGVRAMEVVRDMSKNGVNLNLLKALYAGAAGAALCSIFVGAAHYASYCYSRRTIMAQLHVEDKPGTAHSAHAGAHILAHHDPADAQAVAAHAAAASAAAEASSQQQAKLRMVANISAAVIAALVTALVEAPTELFRHNAQAGLLKGSFMAEMVRVVRKQGPRALYWGFLPYCFEALPYDITELMVYGNMADTYDAAQAGKHKHSAAIRKVPQDAWDLATGAVAGTAAVLVSMPFDVIKTYMQTHSAEAMSKAGSGLWANTVLFANTGRQLVAQKGWQAMFVGLSPRLAQQVPGAMVCWWAIEACRRTLEGPDGVEAAELGSEGAPKRKGH